MEDNMDLEKGIGLYTLFLSGLDSGFFWPLNCYIVLEYLQTEPQFIGFYSGLIPMSYFLGKLVGHKIISHLTLHYNIKWVLITLLFGSALAIIFFGLFSSFLMLICCRILSGFCYNFQFAVRKYLISIDYQAKGDWNSTAKKSLWAIRMGFLLGLAVGSFLTSCEDFLPDNSKFVQKKFLFSSLIVLLLDLSAILLLFSIKTLGFVYKEPQQKYTELPEIKDQKESPQSSDRNVKEKSDLANYLQSSVLSNEHLPSEESVSPEEVKYYSPKNIINKELVSRRLNSARPKLEPSFKFPDANSETKEHERHEGDGKRTHISFIEEEFDNIEELHNGEIPETPVISKPQSIPETNIHLKFALSFRICCNFVAALIFESLPYWFFITSSSKSIYTVGRVLFFIYSLGSLIFLLSFESLLGKFSYYFLTQTALGLSCGLVFILPLLNIFHISPIIAGFFCIWILLSSELYMPCGTIIIADSVPLSQREGELEKNDFLCLCAKALAAYIGPILIIIIPWHTLGLWILSLSYAVLLWHSRKLASYFPCLTEVPYKL
ncbi:hypothetical protein SteCoe_30115 [Stentor coeruleus]|uniref:Major facilitator superfamily associated domain-containing protein n=1 Tax=Stentor coeruleus TaxID=5963 RepID=A0A1R2B4A0_9CILI|nr:hypothetical protein SteCoe_30115 [Stentor coeruleus]